MERKVKTAFVISSRSYRSTLEELLNGLGQGSTSATDIWGIMHGLVMHVLALSFVGILILSVAKRLQHEPIGEVCIDDTCMGTANPHATSITLTSNKTLMNEER
jgi:hypothetical protein